MPVPVEAKVVETPLQRLLLASRSVIVTVDEALPFAVTPELGETEIVELAATGGPALMVKDAVTPERPAGEAMLRVFVPAAVVVIEPVATPDALVTAAG